MQAKGSISVYVSTNIHVHSEHSKNGNPILIKDEYKG